jgi:lipopolysaccharide biosynthesis glycosyltransferase
MSLHIPIVIAFTENYFVPAVTCLSSILKNSDSKYKFEIICLLTKTLPQEYQSLLMEYCPERLKFRFLNLEGKLDGVYVDERYTIAASFRLLLPEILMEYNKIIYTDCDVIIRNDLGDLFENINLVNNYLAAVYEVAIDHQIPYIKELGCEPGYYFNSGFLVMNLELMRNENLSEKLINGLKVPYLQFPDQDVLNIYCKNKVLGLPPIYNGIRTYFLPQYKDDFINRYSVADWHSVQSHGTIHYTGGKPWNELTVKFEVWWKYYFDLPSRIKSKWTPIKKIQKYGKIFTSWPFSYFVDPVVNYIRVIKNK